MIEANVLFFSAHPPFLIASKVAILLGEMGIKGAGTIMASWKISARC